MEMEEPYGSGTVPMSSSASGWVKRISNLLGTETVANNIDHLPPVSIFQVPGTIRIRKPEAYAPQLIAMGPYHHLNPHLYQMERYKLASVKQISTMNSTLRDQILINFQGLVIDRFREMDPYVRACYDKFMDYDQDTLAWIVAIDGCFFLHLANSYLYAYDDEQVVDRRLLDNTIITRDIMMLENQIPFLVLKEIRKALGLGLVVASNSEDIIIGGAEDPELVSILLRFCESISPVQLSVDDITPNAFLRMPPLHLLDLMYRLIVDVVPAPDDHNEDAAVSLLITSSSSGSRRSIMNNIIKKEKEEELIVDENLDEILDLVESSGTKRTQEIIRPVKVLSTIPWSSISGVFRKANLGHQDKNIPSQQDHDEIGVPSVSHLWRYAKVQCRPIVGSIGEIRFSVEGRRDDHGQEAAVLYLPVLNLNASAEVIFRNLVAFELAAKSNNLEFGRYVNLMNGIVDTAEDAKLLRKNGVIKGSLKDQEIAEMFNGMRRCYVGSSYSDDHDHDHHQDHKKKKKTMSDHNNVIEVAIREVNRYYEKQLVVKVVRQLKRDLNASWKGIALFSTLALLILVSLQTFCDFYHCNTI